MISDFDIFPEVLKSKIQVLGFLLITHPLEAI